MQTVTSRRIPTRASNRSPACSVLLGGGLLSKSSETHNGSLGGDGRGSGELISTTSDLLTGLLALPDADSGSLHGVFTAEGRHVGGVLTDLELLHNLSERSTISSTVLSADADLLSSLSHFVLLDLIINNKSTMV